MNEQQSRAMNNLRNLIGNAEIALGTSATVDTAADGVVWVVVPGPASMSAIWAIEASGVVSDCSEQLAPDPGLDWRDTAELCLWATQDELLAAAHKGLEPAGFMDPEVDATIYHELMIILRHMEEPPERDEPYRESNLHRAWRVANRRTLAERRRAAANLSR